MYSCVIFVADVSRVHYLIIIILILHMYEILSLEFVVVVAVVEFLHLECSLLSQDEYFYGCLTLHFKI